MPATEINKNKTSEKKRFDQRDWDYIAEFAKDTLEKRKRERSEHEKIWKDIDRQVRMEPEVTHKLDTSGRPDPNKNWLPEVELPLQAQTLEVLVSDARRMMFPPSGSWYEPHAALTDKYLDRVDFSALLAGDENEVPSQINQDNADKLIQGVLDHFHRQYDFFGNIDQINAQAFTYGVGVGRVRKVKKQVFLNTAKGIVKQNQVIPVIFPRSIRNTYLDNSAHHLMNEGHIVGPMVLFEKTIRHEDLVMAANKGSTDPKNPDGGWMPKQLARVEPDKNGDVQLIELEGDIIVPRKTTSSIYIPNAIATVAVGKNCRTVRFRFRDLPYSSYILFPYHKESLESAYATSPLMKGWPIQKAAVDALSRVVESSALQNQPPIGYDRDDMQFAQSGGPRVFPGAQWGTTSDINVYDEIGGDPSALFNVYAGYLQQYSDVTGINAPRLGAQTNSHTTAYAKEAELQRGTIRTVDYVRSTLKGPMTQFLSMEYSMGRDLVDETMLYIDAYNGFVNVSKDSLPDEAVFEVHGSGGPAEEQAKQQQRMESLQMALQMDQVNVQLGGQPTIDLSKMIEQTLREGKWTDVDAFIRTEAPLQASAPDQLAGLLTSELGTDE